MTKEDEQLFRIAKAWGKLNSEQRFRFREHIDGRATIVEDLIPTIAVARLLHTSFYKVKAMVKRGEITPAQTRSGTYDGPFWLFRRTDIEAMAVPRKPIVVARGGLAYRLRLAGLTFKQIAAQIGATSVSQAARWYNNFEFRIKMRSEMSYIHCLEGETWFAKNCWDEGCGLRERDKPTGSLNAEIPPTPQVIRNLLGY